MRCDRAIGAGASHRWTRHFRPRRRILDFIDDEETRCPAGSFIYIPAGAVHGFRVAAVPSEKLNLYVPPAMVGYFDELAAAIASGDAGDDKPAAIAERYGTEVVGPCPRATSEMGRPHRYNTIRNVPFPRIA